MISRDVFAEILNEFQLLKKAVPTKIFQDVLFSAWNDCASETKQAWSRFPPKETPCGTKMQFSKEYLLAVSTSEIKKDERIQALFRSAPSPTMEDE
jgi:hypothetical protein